MHKSFWIVIILLIAGICIVVLPDSENRVFSLNKAHGPSLQDVIGLVLIIGGWLWVVLRIVKNRGQLFIRLGMVVLRALALLVVIGGGLIVIGILAESNGSLWTGITLSILAYVLLMIPAFRKNI